MRINRIELENIRCFEHIVLDLCSKSTPSPWTLILGDNGTGKSTLLRSIALCLSSPKLSGALFEDAKSTWLRTGTKRGSIRIDFDSREKIELSIKLEKYGESITKQRANPDELIWDKIFICGYGAGRTTFGSRSFERYSSRDSVSSLFDYDSPLQNPELILHRLNSSLASGKEILSWIDNVLMLPDGSTRLGISGLEIRGPWGDYAPVGSLGDGYQATLAWILDMLGWAMFRDYGMLKTGVEGIILIDEIEQHLHPIWQKKIIGVLHQQFPKVQFISTTHSPLCVIGTTDLKDEDISLILLRQMSSQVEAIDELIPPRGLRADQVLTSYLFGLDTTSDNETKSQIERLSALLSPNAAHTPRTPHEIESLRVSLKKKLGSEETELERIVSSAVQEVLASSSSLIQPPQEAVNFEIKRQLRELLSSDD